MSTKTVALPVVVYFNPDGAQTCCLSHPEGKSCIFLQTSMFGTKDSCAITGLQIYRGGGGFGWLEPVDCPLSTCKEFVS